MEIEKLVNGLSAVVYIGANIAFMGGLVLAVASGPPQYSAKDQNSRAAAIHSPPPGPTKRLQDKFMSYGGWKQIGTMPSSLYSKDDIGKPRNQSCNPQECYQMIVMADAYDARGNRLPNDVSLWGRLVKR